MAEKKPTPKDIKTIMADYENVVPSMPPLSPKEKEDLKLRIQLAINFSIITK